MGKDMRKQSSGIPSHPNRPEEPQEFGDVSQYRELNAIGTGWSNLMSIPFINGSNLF